jgi:hypothetical protein
MPTANLANVAQLVEQRFRKPQVVSSILTVGSSFWCCGRATPNVPGRFGVGRSESVRSRWLQFFELRLPPRDILAAGKEPRMRFAARVLAVLDGEVAVPCISNPL